MDDEVQIKPLAMAQRLMKEHGITEAATFAKSQEERLMAEAFYWSDVYKIVRSFIRDREVTEEYLQKRLEMMENRKHLPD